MPGGRSFLVIGFASGKIPSIQANRILLKNISIVGLHWGAYRTHDPAKIGEANAELFALYEKSAIRPVVSSVRPLGEAAAALEEIASRRSVGKVVLIPQREESASSEEAAAHQGRSNRIRNRAVAD